MSLMFECEKCGQCCRHLDQSELFKDLDRGDGICRHLIGNLCGIYENRPIKCRVDLCYELYFQDQISRQQFYEMNYKICKELKGE